jgi:hypothetical protein
LVYVECVVDGWRIDGGRIIIALLFSLAKSQKIAGSIPYGVVGDYNGHIPQAALWLCGILCTPVALH